MGTHGRFSTGEWKENSSRYSDLCRRNVHNILKLGRDEKGRKPFEQWFLNFNVLKNPPR